MQRATLARMREYLGMLAAEVDATRRDEAFQRALDGLARFWECSPCNQWLIRAQRPDATRVAGSGTWAKLGRKPKPGEKPLWLLAYSRRRKPPFVIVHAWDVKQTRGKRLLSLDVVLKGRTRHAQVLDLAARRLGVEVLAFSLSNAPLGVSLGGRVRLRPGLSQRERVATLAHELAHEVLHQAEAERRRKRPLPTEWAEAEAEATAYVVQKVLGLPSRAPTWIAWAGGSGAMIGASLGRIQRAARTILRAARGGPLGRLVV